MHAGSVDPGFYGNDFLTGSRQSGKEESVDP
jgi:hypothetical protein